VVEPAIGPRLAEIVADPGDTLSARPCDPDALLTMATVPSDDAQFTIAVRSAVDPSL
jgi:hypothetical protein